MHGQLFPGALPELLGELYLGGRTGRLELRRSEKQRLVASFLRGRIVALESEGLLAEEPERPRPGDRLDTAKIKLTQLLQELGIKPRSVVPRSDRAAELLSALGWVEGSCRFEDAEAVLGDPGLDVSTGEVILEAIRRIQDAGVVRRALGNQEGVLAYRIDPVSTLEKATLNAVDGQVLELVNGVRSAREVLEDAPGAREEAERSLLGLMLRGVVEYVFPASVGEYEPPVLEAIPADPEPAEEPVVEAEPQPPSPAAAPVEEEPRSASPPVAAVESPELEAFRREVHAAFLGLAGRNHFEVLGVPEIANPSEIDAAYAALAQRFDPEAHSRAELGDLQEELKALSLRIRGAHETLSRGDRRVEYEAELRRRRNREVASEPTEGVAEPRLDPNEAEMALIAEEKLLRAEGLLVQGRAAEAVPILEGAVSLVRGRRKQRARLLLARAYLSNPASVRRGEEILNSILTEDPGIADAHFLLGRVYKERGMQSRAAAMFRKTLELKPGHKGAAAELASEAPLLRKLFGRR